MRSVVLLARLLLVVVFATAATAKLRDRGSFADTVSAFGVPPRLARYVAVAVPAVELATAVALLVQDSARWGALAGALLFVLFIAVVARALGQGLEVDCNCFGQLSSQQIGWKTLARNGALLLVAVFAVIEAPGASLSGWTTSLAAADLIAVVAVLGLAIGASTALSDRTQPSIPATALSAAHPPDVGDQAPDFQLTAFDGSTVSLDRLREPELPILLVFASPNCSSCVALMSDLARWSAALAERIQFAVIASGVSVQGDLRAMFGELGDLTVMIEPEREVAERYLVSITPTALALDPSGRIAHPAAHGPANIERLVRTITHDGSRVPGRRVPDPTA